MASANPRPISESERTTPEPQRLEALQEENKELKETVVLHFKVSRQLWEKFKEITPSSKTLEQAVTELIEQKVKA